MAPRRRRVVWTEQASTALDEAIEYVAHSSPTAARTLLQESLAAAESLAELSDRGRPVPEAPEQPVREILVQRYRILYAVRDGEVAIVGFLHGARDFATWRRAGGLDSPAG